MSKFFKGFSLMIIAITVFTCVGVAIANAADTPKPPQEDKEITIKLRVSQWNVVVKSLSKLPYEESSSIIDQLMVQAQTQLRQQPALNDTIAAAKKDSTTARQKAPVKKKH